MPGRHSHHIFPMPPHPTSFCWSPFVVRCNTQGMTTRTISSLRFDLCWSRGIATGRIYALKPLSLSAERSEWSCHSCFGFFQLSVGMIYEASTFLISVGVSLVVLSASVLPVCWPAPLYAAIDSFRLYHDLISAFQDASLLSEFLSQHCWVQVTRFGWMNGLSWLTPCLLKSLFHRQTLRLAYTATSVDLRYINVGVVYRYSIRQRCYRTHACYKWAMFTR